MTYVGAERGLGCELLELDDNMGLRFQLSVLIQYDSLDPLAYKRWKTAANLAIISQLEERGIKLGQHQNCIAK